MTSLILVFLFLCVSILIIKKVKNLIRKSDEKLLENEIVEDFKDEFNVSNDPSEYFMEWLENND